MNYYQLDVLFPLLPVRRSQHYSFHLGVRTAPRPLLNHHHATN